MTRRHDPWFDLPWEERRIQYAKRKAALDTILTDVRMHRISDCEGAPLCPGSDATDKLAAIKPWEYGEFVATCLAHLADDAEEIENLRAQIDQANQRVRAAEQEREAAVRDADAGWNAYRVEAEKRRPEPPIPTDEAGK